jgi:superfamily II DNA or RNA helicase
MKLRPYQANDKQRVEEQWTRGDRNVLLVEPTGAGKTVIFSEIIREHAGASCAIAHRQELVTQISTALARDGVKHRIIGPSSVIKLAVNLHMSEVGRSYYDPSARCAVAGVDTLIRRGDSLADWLPTVTLWVQDEAHHMLTGNKWGLAASMFPNARGLGVTATPQRADGKGLGRHVDGLFDCMVEGPTMRTLIDDKFLTDYRVFAPPSDIDLSEVPTGASGDWTQKGLSKAVQKSHVVGDVVSHYMRIASGKLGVTFATDVAAAHEIADKFNACGVPAEVVHAKTPTRERVAILRRFKSRELLQLVNVDLFGEGFDLPAIEVVSMARPTQSYALYAQQFGRSLRLMAGKQWALIIDHVGNVVRHGLPDGARIWSLDRRERRSNAGPSDAIPVKSCPSCAAVYERIHKVCPFCGHYAEPGGRSAPEFVDGDLTELDAATLAALRGAVDTVDMDPEEYRLQLIARNCPPIGQTANVKRHMGRQEAQEAVRGAISWWGGLQRSRGVPDSEAYRRFYFAFGVDVMTAQTLHPQGAFALADKINANLALLLTEPSTAG